MASSSSASPSPSPAAAGSTLANVVGTVFGAKVVSSALGAAADLSLADVLKEHGPLSLEELAKHTGTHAPSLERLMRTLIGNGFFARDPEDGRYRLNEAVEVLAESHPQSCKQSVKWITSGPGWKPYCDLAHSVKTGQSAFEHQFKMPIWEWFQKHDQETSALFNGAMTEISSREGEFIVANHDFSGYGTIVDVGGGHGGLVSLVLSRFPSVKRGIVYDLDHVVNSASSSNALLAKDEQLRSRIEFQAGSFFDSAPKGGDAYLLKHITHDWGDEACIKILTHIRANMNPGARVLIFDFVIPDDNNPHPGKILDMEMLAILGSAQERTAKEFEVLLNKTGFKLTKVTGSPVGIGIVEGEALAE